VLLEQAVQDDHRVAQGARHHEPEEADAASRGVVDVCHAFATAEVFGVRAGVYRADWNDEADSVGRGQFPAAQSLRQRERRVDVDEAVVGGGDRVGADIALLDPRQSGTCECGELRARQWLEADVAGLGQQHGAHADRQIVSSRAMLIDVGEVRGEAGPGLHLQQ